MGTKSEHRIRKFYDRSSRLWLDVFGEHLHHGYYLPGKKRIKSRQAQINYIDHLLDWGGIEDVHRVLDVGCGVGGSSRYFASRFGAQVLGVNISPVQTGIASKLIRQAGLDDLIDFRTMDAAELGSPDGPFDLIWIVETLEHIREKRKLIDLFYTMLEPGGVLIISGWYCRKSREDMGNVEDRLVKLFEGAYHLPPLASRHEILSDLEHAGFTGIASADWGRFVTPHWPRVIRLGLQPKSIIHFLQGGWLTWKGAFGLVPLMLAYRKGWIDYIVFRAARHQ